MWLRFTWRVVIDSHIGYHYFTRASATSLFHNSSKDRLQHPGRGINYNTLNERYCWYFAYLSKHQAWFFGGISLFSLAFILTPYFYHYNIRRTGIMAEHASLTAVPDVDIDPSGKFKYILIKVFNPGNKNDFKYIVRGYSWAAYHGDIYDQVEAELKKLKLDSDCVGGGRITHKSDSKTIEVFGYSQGFGKADHSISTELIKKKYPDYSKITWSDEGY